MKRPIERKVKIAVSSAFGPTWRRYSKTNPALKETLTEFNLAKRKSPPDRLPDKMQDHVLSGSLQGIRECHLDHDVLLLYTHADDVVKLLLVCEHVDLKGDRGKQLARQISKLK